MENIKEIERMVETALRKDEEVLILGREKFVIKYSDNCRDLDVWSGGGCTSIFSKEKIADRESTMQYVKDIAKCIHEYLKGNIRCSACGKLIKKAECGGRYFAGIYCDECWKNTYRAIAAQETYN